MAFQTGTQVNAALGRTDYTPFLQGALQGAQAQARGAENIAAGLAGLGQQVASGLEKYYKKQEENKLNEQAADTVGRILKTNPAFGEQVGLKADASGNFDPKAIGVVVKSLGGAANTIQFANTLNELTRKQTEETQAAQYANALTQSGGAPVSLESGPMSPVAEMKGRDIYLNNLYKQSEIAKNLAATNKQPVEFGVVKVPMTDPDTGITTVSVVDNRTGKTLSTYVEKSPITIGAPAPGTVIKQNPDGTITSVAISGAPKTEEQIKREEAAVSKKTAQENFGNHVRSAFSSIMALNDMGAMVNPANDMMTNLKAKVSASNIGQIITGIQGSEVASIQKQLSQIKPLMITALAEATGIKASQLSSNKELDFYLDAMADPNKDFYSNLAALDSISKQIVGKDIIGELLQDKPEVLSRIRREANTLQARKPIKLEVKQSAAAAPTTAPTPQRVRVYDRETGTLK